MAQKPLVAQLDPSMLGVEPQAEDMVDPQTGVPNSLAKVGRPDYSKQLLAMFNSPEHKALIDQAQQSIEQQRAGIPQSEKILENAKNQAMLKPLAALSDQWFGGDMSKNYASPEDIAKLQQGLQQQRQGLTTEQINLLKNASDSNIAKMYAMGQRLDQRQQGLGMTEDKITQGAVDKVTNDKLLGAAIPRVQGLNRIDSQLQAAISGKFKLTPQFLNDVNNEYVAALTGKSNYGEGSLERASYNNAEIKLAKLKQYVESNAQNINSPDVIKQINAQIQGLKGDWGQAINERAKMLQRNYAHVPAATKAQRKAIDDMINTYGTKSIPTQEEAPHPVDQMSDEEVIKAYNKKMGK